MPPRSTRASSSTATFKPLSRVSTAVSKPASKAAPASTTSVAKHNGAKDGKSVPERKAPLVKKRRAGPEINSLPCPPDEEEYETLFMFIWGNGDQGQFGNGPKDDGEKSRPAMHVWFQDRIRKGKFGENGGLETVAAGGMHTLAVNTLGQVHSWGVNDEAALGRVTLDVPDPRRPGRMLSNDDLEGFPYVIEELDEEGFRAVKVAAGDSISVAISDTGELRAWGTFRGDNGVLGFDGAPDQPVYQFTPTPLPALERVEVTDVACGAHHALALTSEGHVYVWGDGQHFQLGRRVLDRWRLNGLEPERLGLRNIVHIATGQYHSFAVDKNGIVYAWGLNEHHQTGVSGRAGDEKMVIRPQAINSLSPDQHNGARVIQISGGAHHSLFLLDNGEVWGCGRCDADELGLAEDHPAQIGVAERREDAKHRRKEEIKQKQAMLDKMIASGKSKDLRQAEDALNMAKAALNVRADEHVPEIVRIAFPPIPANNDDDPELPPWEDDAPVINPIVQISAGTRHNLAVSHSGHVYAWGLGIQSQLGLGSQVERASVPTLVLSKELRPYHTVEVSAGGQHCVLLARYKDDGEAD